MDTSANRKKLFHLAGGLLTLLGLAYVAYRLSTSQALDSLAALSFYQQFLVLIAAVLYALISVFLTLGWKSLLSVYGTNCSFPVAMQVTGRSQIAKYVPGNIFHLLSRQAIASAHGIPGWTTAKSSAAELGIVALSGASFIALAVPMSLSGMSYSVSILAFPILISILFLASQRIFGKEAGQSVLYYTAFHLCSGTIFLLICLTYSPASAQDFSLWIAIVGAYCISWLAGFLTPGSPGGLGVRELVLLLLLSSAITEDILLVELILARLVTVVGDLLFFGLSFTFRRK